MNEDLKHRASIAAFWSFCDRAGQYGIQGLVSVFLARLLLPSEVGLIGMIWIFVSLAQLLSESGLGQALLQKQDATRTDECTVFYFNLLVACLGMALLWLGAPWIARFYRLPILMPLTRVLALNLPLTACSMVPATLLSKRLDLHTQAKAGVLAALFSGALALSMAFLGCGVWSLVGLSLSQSLVRSLLLWHMSKWRPRCQFNLNSLRSMFSFGVKLLFSNVLDAIFRNINSPVIGKLFSAQALGFYTVATRIPSLIGDSLVTIVSRVTLPTYPIIRSDKERYKNALRKALTLMMIVNVPLMIGLAVLAKPMVRGLLTDRWLPSVPYLQLYCVLQLLSTLHWGNIEALLGLGRSDLYFNLGLARIALILLSILICWPWGISALILGQIVVAVITFRLQAHYVGKLIGYGIGEQVRDLAPSLLVGTAMGGLVFATQFVPLPLGLQLGLQVLVGTISFISLCVIFHLAAFCDLLEIVSRLRAQFLGRLQGQSAGVLH